MRVGEALGHLLSMPASLRARSTRSREFSEAGLLAGLSGRARRTRMELLTALSDRGVSTVELVHASKTGKLAHLSMTNALTAHKRKYTLEEISARAGLPLGDVEKWFRAMGRGVSSPTSADFGDEDLRLARVLPEYRRLGLDETMLFASARILGRNLWAMADAVEALVDQRLSSSSDQPEVGLRLALEVTRLAEFQANILAHVVANRLQLLAFPDKDFTGAPATGDIAVGFADLVGFTSLGEVATPTELAQLAERLDGVTTEAVQPPVRFVKTVGDAVMLISPDPNAIARTMQRIFAAAREANLPPLHAGIAWGPALPSAGDWIGRTVNLASRISAVAQPDDILVDDAMRAHLDATATRCVSAGTFDLKGYGKGRELYRLSAY